MTNVSRQSTPSANTAPNNYARITLWPLIAATFLMVSGGTYGIEDIVRGAGYGRGILILLLTPLLWSLPTALMMGELTTALPCEGGYYVWVRRAMGNFWGFQEAWLSLVASIFDMAIYPTLFVAYMRRLFPSVGIGHRGFAVALAVVLVCAAMNIAGIRVVTTTSFWVFLALMAPFVCIVLLAPWKHGALVNVAHSTTPEVGIVGGMLVAMWNYMGWDNASTIAAEVERPQRTYPRALMTTIGIIALSYTLPVAAMWMTGIAPSAWETGSWADLGALVAGNWLRVAIVVGGMLSAFGMFNSLVLSYSRVPMAMAEDGMLPRAFARVSRHTGAPVLSIVVLTIAWACCLTLGFERLVLIDVLVYGAALMLEFVALVVLRVREPELPREFRVPGGRFGAVAVGIFPAALLLLSVVRGEHETLFGLNALLVGALLVVAGCVLYPLARAKGARAAQTEPAGGA